MAKKEIVMTPAAYACKMLYLEGKPFSMDALPFMVPIFNCGAERQMMMTGRQVGKSTLLSAKVVSKMSATPHHSMLYVAPRLDQVAEFSKAKLTAMISGSPNIRNYFINASVEQQARSKQFLNYAAVVLRSCYLNPDGIRGITANDIYIDEVQDIILENIPVIEECSSRKFPRSIFYTGTPKTFDNTIEKKWRESSQHYWAVKCNSCNHWNVPLGMENIGKESLVCAKCGRPINALEGMYAAKVPTKKFIGFHISQMMIAGAPGTGVPWSRIIDKLEDPLYGLAKFHNECLGFSYDIGSKLLTESDLVACSYADEMPELTIERKAEWGIYTPVAGVDWGVLGGNTRTVLTIGGLQPEGNLRVMYAKKFPVDQDPVMQIDEICSICNQAGVAVIAADRGNGHVANSLLRKNLAFARVAEIEYKAKVNEGMIYNNKTKTWITDRTRALAGVIIDIKTGKIRFPAYNVMGTFHEDLLTLSCKYNDNLRAYQILRENEVPDDFAHAVAYLRLAGRYIGPNPRATKHSLEDWVPGMGTSVAQTLTDKEVMDILL